MTTPILKVAGIGKKSAEQLREKGIESAEDLLAADRTTLIELPGFSASKVESTVKSAAELVGAEVQKEATPEPDKGAVLRDKGSTGKVEKRSGQKKKKVSSETDKSVGGSEKGSVKGRESKKEKRKRNRKLKRQERNRLNKKRKQKKKNKRKNKKGD